MLAKMIEKLIRSKSLMKKYVIKTIFLIMPFSLITCDFSSLGGFKVPTWFFDITFPLVQNKFSFENMVDNKQIFSTPDSIGMQLMFEGALPDTSIGSDILEITLDKSIPFSLDPTPAPTSSQTINIPFDTTIDIIPSKTLVNSSGVSFNIPPSQDQQITKDTWNTIAAAFNASIQIPINIPSISLDQFDFVESIDGYVIKEDAGANVSTYTTTIANDGLPSNITNPISTLTTTISGASKTLSSQTQASIAKDASFSPSATSLSKNSIGNSLSMNLGFGLESISSGTSEETLFSYTSATLESGWTNAWQTFSISKSGALSKIILKIGNLAAASDYTLALYVYTADNDASSANPNSKFSGAPFDKSNTVTINRNTAIGEVEFPFSSGKNFDASTNYYFWLKEEGANPAGTGGQKIVRNSSENDGGSGNSFARLYHKINTLTGDLITINSGDKLQVDMSVQLKMAGFDSAIVKIAETEIPVDIPAVEFPAVVELYSGKLISPSAADINEIKINSIISGYPMDVSFLMNFKNFKPPAGKDSTKLDTLLKKGVTIKKDFNLDGYTFYNPAGADSALKKLTLETSAKIIAQTSTLPLDGSNFGGISFDVGFKGLHFESMEANIVQEFEPTTFAISGMPLGFSGWKFVDTKLEIEMYNGIRLPVILDFDMVGINQDGDTSKVNALSTLASPVSAKDTTKTIIRLSSIGTTTLKYQSPGSLNYSDSSNVSPKNNETTIVELMSSNPAVFNVNSRAKIDGRGTIEAGMTIGGKYRMLAPFEIIMEPMTFISVTNSPVQEMDHANRNRIRSTLQSASMTFTVENKIPSAGDLSMLMSNTGYFPLDTTKDALSAFKDSMVVKLNWSKSDSVYIVSACDSLNPELSDIYIFNVMDDYSDCINGLTYLVKSTGGITDTAFSYVDTLLKIPLPEPKSFYAVTNSGVHAGQVREAGITTYASPLPAERVRLMTDPGQPFMAPRFRLDGSNGKKVYMTTGDYLKIDSFVTFSLSSTGMSSPPPNEMVVKYPNGGQSIDQSSSINIKWETYGTISKVDIAYFAGGSPNVNSDDGWVDIATEINNENTYAWTPSGTTGISSLSSSLRDSIRIRVKSTDGKVRDMSGWYFSITDGGGSEAKTEIAIDNIWDGISKK